MIGAITTLLVFQVLGEIVAHLFHLPIPGPVVGMLFLFLTLLIRGGVPPSLKQTSQNLLQHLALFFIPAGVGVMLHLYRLKTAWLPIVGTLFVSTALTLGFSAWLLARLSHKTPWHSEGECDEL